jgi:transcriptional regulator with XRE-family HTH domain
MERFRRKVDELGGITEVSVITGISRPTLEYWYYGARTPKSENIVILCNAFGVTADWLLGLSDHPTINEDMKTAIKVTGLSQTAIEKISRFMHKSALSAFLEESALYDLIQNVFLYRDELTAIKDVMESLKQKYDYSKMINFGMWFNDARLKRQGFRDEITALVDKIVPSKEVLAEAEELYNSKVIYKPATMWRDDNGKH